MTLGEISKGLMALGWSLQMVQSFPPEYRATCVGFSTPWRNDPDAVLNDVLAIKAKENAEVKPAHRSGRYAGKSEGGV